MSGDLGRALTHLRKALAKGRTPDVKAVREVLVPYGERLIDGAPDALDPDLVAIRELFETEQERLEPVVAKELELAAWEFTQSVDPRYLDRPDYDLEYTVEARERLEARFAGADALGFEIDEALLGRVHEADERLAPLLDGGS